MPSFVPQLVLRHRSRPPLNRIYACESVSAKPGRNELVQCPENQARKHSTHQARRPFQVCGEPRESEMQPTQAPGRLRCLVCSTCPGLSWLAGLLLVASLSQKKTHYNTHLSLAAQRQRLLKGQTRVEPFEEPTGCAVALGAAGGGLFPRMHGTNNFSDVHYLRVTCNQRQSRTGEFLSPLLSRRCPRGAGRR